MAYEVVLERFSGPLDLLLHLIQKQEINIHDIPIATVTEQYLQYLRAMEQLSLEIASEFVVMAATLLAIKSRMLLPRVQKADGEEIEIDPREELVNQLVEYQRCKWAADQLRDRSALQSLVFSREPMDLRPYAPTELPPLEGVSLWSMVDAFRKLISRIPHESVVAEIRGHVVSVEETMEWMYDRLRKIRTTTFYELCAFAQSRPQVVAAFLAVLEMMKLGWIRCTQVLQLGDIEIVLSEERLVP